MSADIHQADATIASAMDNTLSLLQSLGCTSDPVNPVTGSWFIYPTEIRQLKYCLDSELTSLTESPTSGQMTSAVTSLAHLASIRSSIVDLYTSHLEKIEQGARSLPSTKEIEIEASQLRAALNPRFIESAQEAAFKQQINDMCELLEADDAGNDLLQQVLLLGDVDGTGASLDIRGELEEAWSLDQAQILESKGKLLDAVCI
jgi:hypothetical protein